MVAIAKKIDFPSVEHVILYNVGWELYEHLLREAGRKRLTYDEGTLEIMSPLPIHETIKTMLGSMVELLALETRRPMSRRGSTTFKNRLMEKGLEPDECYYLRDPAVVRGVDRFDPQVTPPPDLVIEVDITRGSLPRQPIYQRLGVAELWRFDGERLHVLHLRDGVYHEHQMSLAFPMLRPADLIEFLVLLPDEDETEILYRFQQWVRERFVG